MGGLGMEGWSGGKDGWMEHGWMDGGRDGWMEMDGWRELGRGEWVEHRQMDESTTCVYIGLTDALVVRAT